MDGRRQVSWVSETSPRTACSAFLLSSEEDMKRLRDATSEGGATNDLADCKDRGVWCVCTCPLEITSGMDNRGF